MLEGGDRAVGIGEGGLEMGEDLRGRLACGVRRRPRRQLGRRAASAQGGADLALGQAEPLPDALPGPLAQLAIDVRLAARMLPATAGWRNRHRAPVVRLSRRILSASQTLKVRPQPGRAWRLLQKIRRAQGFSLALEAVQAAVPNQVPTALQCGQGDLLEPLGKRQPFVVVAEKPALAAHETMSPKSRFYLSGAG